MKTLSICAGMFLCAVFVSSCADAPATPAAAAMQSASFPHGVDAFLTSLGLTTTGPVKVAFTISTDPGWTFTDPALTHEAVPQYFLGVMNTRIGSQRFVQANGTAGHMQVTLRFFEDPTGSRRGVHVYVTGFPASSAIDQRQGPTTWPICYWFSFDLPAYYIDGPSVVQAAANQTMDKFINGW